MKTMMGLTVVAFGLLIGSLSGVTAKEYNQRPHLDPASQSKVNSVIANGYRMRGGAQKNFGRVSNVGCGGINIGAVDNSGRPPREVIIVARDIINVNTNC